MDDNERIKQRAHEIWESEGRPHGRDSEHWARAEQELRNQFADEGQAAEQSGGESAGDDAQPELEQTASPATAKAPAPKKRTRKPKAAPTPYLNDEA